MMTVTKNPEIGQMATITVGNYISIQGRYLGAAGGDLHMVEVDGQSRTGRLVKSQKASPLTLVQN